MAKRTEESYLNLYQMNKETAQKETIDEIMKRKKAKEREKRIKENKRKEEANSFDQEMETVINMTNRNKIQKEQKRKNEQEKRQREKERKRNKRQRLIKVMVLVFLIIGATIFATVSPLFNIQEVQVMNNNKIPSNTIISLSELTVGNNIFKFNKQEVKNKIKQNAYVENVQIRRKIPSYVVITVEERVAEYSAEYMGKYALLDSQGYILEIVENPQNLLILQGANQAEEEWKEGQLLREEEREKLDDVKKIRNVLKDNQLDEKVTSFDISQKNEYSIYLKEEEKTIHLGDTSNLSNKMPFALAMLEAEKEKAGDIFVNGDLNNKFRPYFREKVT